MIIFALRDNIKIFVNKSGERAICPKCREEVYGVFGEKQKHHWRHLEENTKCTGKIIDVWKEDQADNYYHNDPEWHDDMKTATIKYCKLKKLNCEIEKTYNRNGIIHRTDACVDGINIEFQRSHISLQEIEERENFYGDMIWILHEDLYPKKINSFSKPYYYYKNNKLFNYLDVEISNIKHSEDPLLSSLRDEKMYNFLTKNKTDEIVIEKINFSRDRAEFLKEPHREISIIIDNLSKYNWEKEYSLLLYKKREQERFLNGLKIEEKEVSDSLKTKYISEYNTYIGRINILIKNEENKLSLELSKIQEEIIDGNKIISSTILEHNKFLSNEIKEQIREKYSLIINEEALIKNSILNLSAEYKSKYPYSKSKNIIEIENKLVCIKTDILKTAKIIEEIKGKL